MYYDFLELECIALITKISCLLVFYKFELSPLNKIRFENNKQLYYLKDRHDLLGIYVSFNEIYQNLLNDILEFYEPYFYDAEVWAVY
jgi:hypothetical protein